MTGQEPPCAGGDPAGRMVVLRPVASPLPLGFLALMTGSLMLSALQLHWVPAGQAHMVAVALLAFTTPLQAVACVLAFLARDPAAATGLGVLCGTWATTGVSLLSSPAGHAEPGLGVLLVIAAAALLVPVTVAAVSKVVAAVVIGAAAVRFALSGGYELTASTGWQVWSGVGGLVVAGVAGYGGLAFELEGAVGRTVLPVLRLGRGRRAMSGRLAAQVADLAREPGVREQL